MRARVRAKDREREGRREKHTEQLASGVRNMKWA